MNYRILFSFVLFCLAIIACGSKTGTEQGNSKEAASSEEAEQTTGNYLSMKINGVEWKAEREIFGAFHPKGYNKALIIAGSKGANDKNEQTFNLNLYNIDGPGVYEIQTGDPNASVVQMGNWSPENFLYGSMMGYKMNVNVKTASTKPDVVEATFEGELSGNAGDVMKITEGKFYYHE